MKGYIALSTLRVAPNRQRRTFDPKRLNELIENIKSIGLLNAIGVRVEGGEFFLVHGERRLRAIADIYELGGEFRYDNAPVPAGTIPYTTLGELSSLEREEAELAENIHRDDLPWQERAAATARLMTLRTAQAAAAGQPPPSTFDIAKETRDVPADTPKGHVGYHQEATRREIIVAKHLADPEVRAAKNVDDAFKILKRKEEVERRTNLAAEVGRTFTAETHRLFHGDALEWLVAAAPDQFDVILTDPPYGMGADEFGDSGGMAQGAHEYADTLDNFQAILQTCAAEFVRIAKPLAHLYWFCDLDQFHAAREAFSAAGWWVHRTPLIWHKPSAARTPWPEHGPQRKWEMILYAVKGKRPVTRIYGDVISVSSDSNLGHAAQKPVALLDDLLRRSVSAGDAVLDPFGGTGSILPACHGLKCRATYVEKDPAAYAIAVERLERLKENPELEGL